MSKYTMELRYALEISAGLTESVGYEDEDDVIEDALANDFFPDYPIFDEEYRNVLNTKILLHYYTEEIGVETVGLFRHFLKVRMNEIMPYYNKLYESANLEFNPLHNTDLTTTKAGNKTDIGSVDINDDTDRGEIYAGSANGSNSNTGSRSDDAHGATVNESSDKAYDMFSDTPQGGLENVDNDTKYLTNLTKKTDAKEGSEVREDNSSSSYGENGSNSNETNYVRNNDEKKKRNEDSVLNSTEDYVLKVTGNNGVKSYSKLITEYRETLINIDKMIIDELRNLFMEIW